MANYLKLFENHTQYNSFTQTEEFVKPNVSYCTKENEVHYNPIPDPYNGKAYVDLGLPSGTKWATMNVGANSPTDYGLYFAWGETQGYADASTKAFSWSDYKFNPSGDGSTFTKYNSTVGKTVLDLEDDAAHANWGGDWHMPTEEQCKELLKKTKNGFVTDAGAFRQYAWSDSGGHSSPTSTTATISDWNTYGCLFFKNSYTSVTDAISAGDYLFIPAAGEYHEGDFWNVDVDCDVWTSALSSENVENAWDFYLGSGLEDVYNNGIRCTGKSVRGVVGQMDEIIDVQPT